MTSSKQRNERNRGRKWARPAPPAEAGTEWLWGWHAVLAALENPLRPAPRLLLATQERARQIPAGGAHKPPLEIFDNAAIARYLPQGAVHQGVALKTPPLEPVDLEEMATPAKGLIIMLDQVTDPQNVGAILRSAAVFGARGLIVQDRHAPLLTGALAKAAAGAVDKVPHARVVNLSRALETLTELGWRTIGLDAAADLTLEQALDGPASVIVLGSEGEGLRRLVAEHCDVLAKIPMPGAFESLNVSAAAAIALYEASRGK